MYIFIGCVCVEKFYRVCGRYTCRLQVKNIQKNWIEEKNHIFTNIDVISSTNLAIKKHSEGDENLCKKLDSNPMYFEMKINLKNQSFITLSERFPTNYLII